MATVEMTPDHLVVRFTPGERIAGLLRDVEVPLASVVSVTVEADGLQAVQGLRAPGLDLPGRRKIGTWRGAGRRRVVSVRARQPAVRIGLAGHQHDELLVGADDADGLATRLRAALEQRA